MAAKSPKNVQATAPEQTTNLPVPFEEITEAKAVELGPMLYTESNSLTPYFEHIKASVNEVPDLTTTKGRDRIASLAASVSRSKTAIEKPGRAYLKHIKAVVKPVEQNLKAFVDACDALRDEVRAPLTKWEEEQRANQERLQAKVDYFGEEYQSMLENMPSNLHERADFIKAVLEDIKAEPVGDDFESMKEAGQAAKADVISKMTLAYQAALIESENQRKADAQAEQERLAREKQIAEEAAAKAKADAEAAAKAKIEQAEREKQEAIQREEQQRQAAIREQEAAKQREQQAAEQAAANERARIQREQEAKEAAERQAKEEADRKAANVEHRRAINKAIIKQLMTLGASEELSKAIITAAVNGELGSMVINY